MYRDRLRSIRRDARLGAPPEVVVFSNFFVPGSRAGGPIRSLDALTRSSIVRYRVITKDRDSGDTDPYTSLDSGQWIVGADRSVYYLNDRSCADVAHAIASLRKLDVGCYYFNSFWNIKYTVLPMILILLGVLPRRPIFLAPRGELLLGARLNRAGRKRWFLPVVKALVNLLRVVMHSTTDEEMFAARRMFPKRRHVLVPDVFTPNPVTKRAPRISGDPLRVVYLARIHPHKNLLTAIKAVNSSNLSVHFDIFGEGSDKDYVEQCHTEADIAPPHVLVRWHGHVDHDAAQERLKEFDVLILPTRSENFGHTIREAIAAGCLILTSDATPWTNLLNQSGLKTPSWDDQEGFARALQDLASASPAEFSDVQVRILDGYLKVSADQQNFVDEMAHHFASLAEAENL